MVNINKMELDERCNIPGIFFVKVKLDMSSRSVRVKHLNRILVIDVIKDKQNGAR